MDRYAYRRPCALFRQQTNREMATAADVTSSEDYVLTQMIIVACEIHQERWFTTRDVEYSALVAVLDGATQMMYCASNRLSILGGSQQSGNTVNGA